MLYFHLHVHADRLLVTGVKALWGSVLSAGGLPPADEQTVGGGYTALDQVLRASPLEPRRSLPKSVWSAWELHPKSLAIKDGLQGRSYIGISRASRHVRAVHDLVNAAACKLS